MRAAQLTENDIHRQLSPKVIACKSEDIRRETILRMKGKVSPEEIAQLTYPGTNESIEAATANWLNWKEHVVGVLNADEAC